MKSIKIKSVIFILSCLVVATSASALDDMISVHTLDEKLLEENQWLNPEYLVILPENESDKPLPLFIYLHGGGRRGSDLSKVEYRAIRLWNGLEQFAKEPCIVVVPQCRKAAKGEERGTWIPEDLNLLLQDLKATLLVDADRVYLSGSSMGGYGTWAWAGHYPQHFAAVAPIAGGLGRGGPSDVSADIKDWAKRLSTIPVYAFAGAQDKVVSPDRTKLMIDAIRAVGGTQAQFRIYPEEGHGAANKVYSTPEFFDWILSQKRIYNKTK